MNFVGWKTPFEVPSPNLGEDIVYSMIERHSGEASQPTTTRSSSTSSLIIDIFGRLTRGGHFYE
jgi:hypothetical protein